MNDTNPDMISSRYDTLPPLVLSKFLLADQAFV